MKSVAHVTLVTLVTGFSAVFGSMIGGRWSDRVLLVGAVLGGVFGPWLSSALASRFGLIARDRTKRSQVAAIVAFLALAPVAVYTAHTPVGPLVATVLVGVTAEVVARYS
jgi:predicted MFS family arabinose efflux permease